MFEIHIKGKKKAVLLAWTNIVGYEPDITHEDGTDEGYILHCEVETRWDVDPYRGEEEWNGSCVDLSGYSEEDIRNGEHVLCFQEKSVEALSGFLGVEIQILHKPDEEMDPYCKFMHYVCGKMVERSLFKNPECDMDAIIEAQMEGLDEEDVDEEFMEDISPKFDEWHDFSF